MRVGSHFLKRTLMKVKLARQKKKRCMKCCELKRWVPVTLSNLVCPLCMEEAFQIITIRTMPKSCKKTSNGKKEKTGTVWIGQFTSHHLMRTLKRSAMSSIGFVAMLQEFLTQKLTFTWTERDQCLVRSGVVKCIVCCRTTRKKEFSCEFCRTLKPEKRKITRNKTFRKRSNISRPKMDPRALLPGLKKCTISS